MFDVWFVNLGIKIENLPRVAISILGFEIFWYGVIIAFGILCGLLYVIQEAKRTNQNSDHYSDFLIYALISAVIGARIYYVIFSWENYRLNIAGILNLRQGGIAIYGAIIGAVICAVIYTKRKNLNFWMFADTAVGGLLLGQAIGRWGNFFNREAFGTYTDSLFAMRYLKDDVTIVPTIILENVISVDGIEYIQVHPTFLYESIWNLGIFTFLFFYKKHKKFNGQLFCIYLFGYGVGRFWIEGLRIDQLQILNTDIAVSQIVSILIVVFSCVFYICKMKKRAA